MDSLATSSEILPANLPRLYKVAEYRLAKLREMTMDNPALDTPETVRDFFRTHIEKSDIYRPEVENFIVVLLNTRRRVKGFHIISTGTLDTILVHPREVFRSACIQGAAAIVMVHNHPSGDPTPSEADIKVTRDLIRAGNLMKIEILDHIIMGEAGVTRPRDYVSLRELGYFYS